MLFQIIRTSPYGGKRWIRITERDDEMNIGRFEILQLLKENDHSILYEVKDQDQDKDQLRYVLKMYKEENQGTGAGKESGITQLLENRSQFSVSVPIIRKYQWEGRNCLLLQFRANGRFLRDVFENEGKGNILSVLKLTRKMLKALSILHEFQMEGQSHCILHLDLHPGNIFIENYGGDLEPAIKFLDFSNARMERMTGEHAVLSTDPEGYSTFSAPELIYAKSEMLCRGTDLYSVAAIMYWMLTGQLFQPDMTNIRSELSAYGNRYGLTSAMTAALASFFLCGLEYNPMYRYQSACEMMASLDRIIFLAEALDGRNFTEFIAEAYDMHISELDLVRSFPDLSEAELVPVLEDLEAGLKVRQIDVPKRKYEFDFLWNLAGSRLTVSGKVYKRLIESGITVSNYAADRRLGILLLKEYERFRSDMQVKEYLSISLKLAEQDVDQCRYQKAYERGKTTITCLETIREAYRKCAELCGMDPEKSEGSKELGRVYSAVGRYTAFAAQEMSGRDRLERQKEADQFFSKALQEFADDQDNRQITLYHYLHLLLNKRDRKSFDESAAEYFHTSDPCAWLLGLDLKKETDLFMLHVCLKSLYVFDIGKQDGKLEGRIQDLLKCLKHRNGFHPLELVYRYIGLILFREKGISKEVQKAFHRSLTCISGISFDRKTELNILTVITYQTWAIYSGLTGRQEDLKTAEEMLLIQCQADTGWDFLQNKLGKGLPISELLHYEYA